MKTEAELRELIFNISVPQWEAIMQILDGQLEGLEHLGDVKVAANQGCLTHIMGGINQMRYLRTALNDWRLEAAEAAPVLKQTSI